MNYQEYLRQLEDLNGLPKGLLAVQQQAESNFDPRAVSPAGAQGIAQFMPATAAEYGIDPFDPMQAAQAQAKMMGGLLKKYQGDVPAALAGYNWGQGNVDRKGMDNAPAETRNYIAKITAGLQQPNTIAADVNLQTPVSSSLNLSDMSDADLMAMAQQHGLQPEKTDAKPDLSKLSDNELLALAKQHGVAVDDSYSVAGDLASIPGKALAGVGEGALRTAANITGGIGKAIAEGAQATGIAPEWGADQQSQIGNYLRQINADAPRFTNTNSMGDAARLAGSALSAVPFFMASPLGMIGAGGVGAGADAYEKTGGDPLATAAGAALGAGINAVPASLLGAGQGIAKSALGAAALGAATPDIMQIPERLAGKTPEPVTANERLDSAVNNAILGGVLGRVGAKPEAKAPAVKDIQAARDIKYAEADASGAVLPPQKANALHDAMAGKPPVTPAEKAAAQRNPAYKFAQDFAGIRDNPIKFTDAIAIDQAYSKEYIAAKKNPEKAQEAYLIKDAHERFRDAMEQEFGSLPESAALKDAMSLHKAKRKIDDIQKVIDDAEGRDNPHVAMKNGFDRLYKRAQQRGGWSKDELAQLKQAAKFGTGANLMRFMGGRLFPLITAGAGFATAGAAGLPAAFAAHGMAGGARKMAGKMQAAKGERIKEGVARSVSGTVDRALNPPVQSPMQARLARVGTAPQRAAPAAPAQAAPFAQPTTKPVATATTAHQAATAAPVKPFVVKVQPAQQATNSPAYMKQTKKPQTLSQFVTRLGGLKDTGGDLRAIIGKNKSGLLRPNTGKALDEVALRAWEAGFFPEKGGERPSINDLLDKLAEDINGKPQYSEKQRDEVQRADEAANYNSELDKMVSKHNIDTNGKTDGQIVNELLDSMSQEESLQLSNSIAESMGLDLQEAKRLETRDYEAEVPDEGRLGD
jgi:hypothetical protein